MKKYHILALIALASVSCTHAPQENIAFRKIATASSTFDHNLTSQLLTDGIISGCAPAFIEMATSDGVADRVERENTLDGHPMTRNIITGDGGWVEYRFRGYEVDADRADVLYQEALAGGRGGENTYVSVPVERNDSTGALRFSLSFPRAARWRVKEVAFFRGGERLEGLLPSDHFTSAWMSDIVGADGEECGCGNPGDCAREEWVSVDLGTVRRVDAVVLHWLSKASAAVLEVSRNGADWRRIATLDNAPSLCDTVICPRRARYVRVLMSGGICAFKDEGCGDRYCISEVEVLGPASAESRNVCASDAAGTSCGVLSGDGWTLQRAFDVNGGGAAVSSRDFDDSGWLPARVPSTVLVNYIDAGVVPDPNFGDNVECISDSYFNSDFWYRKVFTAPAVKAGRRLFLEFDGINWKAEIYLNGAYAGRVDGAFRRGRFDVTDALADGDNVLAVRIIRNDHPGTVTEKTARWTGYNGGILGADNPTFHASVGWDWITTVRGRNIGIWDDVRLVEEGAARVSDPLVVSKLSPGGLASMTVSAVVSDNLGVDSPECAGRVAGGRSGRSGCAECSERSGRSGCAECSGCSERSGRGVAADFAWKPGLVVVEGWIGDIHFSKGVDAPGEVVFTPEEFPQLRDREIALWWPNGYGEPALHDAGFVVKVGGEVTDSLSYKAGIREMSWTTDGGALRLFVNGRRVNPMGGNWGFSEQNLRYGAEEFDIALDYHRQQHFNMVRDWVGQICDDEFYDACDRNGMMVWQDFWLANPGDGPDPDDEALFLDNARDLVSKIRRHACLALYCGRNEGDPPQSLDRALKDDVVATLHPDMLYISNSADGVVSGHGPYNAMPTEYYFNNQSGKLHSERGMPNFPTIESLRRMMPEADMWPQGEMWGKHDFTSDGPQKGVTFNERMAAFGEISSAEEYSALAQWVNYEGYRAMFESANSAGRMGILLWMSHSCWPSMMWCTYDYYFEPTGAFFGCRKACEPLHIQYNAVTREVEVVNVCAGDALGLGVCADVYGLHGDLQSSHSLVVDVPEDSKSVCFSLDGLASPDQVNFLVLTLRDSAGSTVSENFYMIPSVPGDLKAVRTLGEAQLRTDVRFEGAGRTRLGSGTGSDGDGGDRSGAGNPAAVVTVRNTGDTPALLVRLILKDARGEEILPAEYSDNYFSLMPGCEKTVRIEWNPSAVSAARNFFAGIGRSGCCERSGASACRERAGSSARPGCSCGSGSSALPGRSCGSGSSARPGRSCSSGSSARPGRSCSSGSSALPGRSCPSCRDAGIGRPSVDLTQMNMPR